MITAEAWSGKHYAVYGLARSGQATVRALLASGARVTAWDERQEAREALRTSLSRSDGEVAVAPATDGGANEAGAGPSTTSLREAVPLPIYDGEVLFADLGTADLSQFDSLVVSPGVPLNTHPLAARAREAGLEIIGDIELFARARPELPPHKVVGITGTNGKSTTTALVHHILKTAGVPTTMGGNIGLPILGQEPLPEGGVYVLELSSYQIDLTQSLDCDVAVLLNITPDHLDRYENFEAYAASKARLFEMQTTGMAVVTDEPGPTRRIFEQLTNRPIGQPVYPPNSVHSFGHARTEGGRTWRPMVIPGETPVSQPEWPSLQGPHNLQNAAAAIAACGILGLHLEQISSGLRTFPGLPHRMERVLELAGVLFVNDSKATNAEAAAPALAAYPRIRWIVGGQAKTHDLGDTAKHLDHVVHAYTIGEAGPMFARLLRERGVAVTESETLENAVKGAAADSQAGEVVLLSPACASFDQFEDFEARGDAFKALVGAL